MEGQVLAYGRIMLTFMAVGEAKRHWSQKALGVESGDQWVRRVKEIEVWGLREEVEGFT